MFSDLVFDYLYMLFAAILLTAIFSIGTSTLGWGRSIVANQNSRINEQIITQKNTRVLIK